jgi:hypothetical protein
MRLRVRTFGCRHVTCAHRLFTARLPGFATPYARNTMRLVNALQAMGLALGGQAGARLAARLRLRRRASPLRRLVRAASIPHIPGRQVLGVDAWAWRRGHRYGTILVDLLPDRSAATIARQLGISRPTVDAYLRRDTPPGPRRFQWRPSARVLTPYLPY